MVSKNGVKCAVFNLLLFKIKFCYIRLPLPSKVINGHLGYEREKKRKDNTIFVQKFIVPVWSQ